MGDLRNAGNKAKTEGGKNFAAGAIKEGAAKLTGNKTGEVEGKAQKAVGKAQNKAGDTAHRAANKADRRI